MMTTKISNTYELHLDKFGFDKPEEVHILWSDESATLYTNFPYLASLEECQARLTRMMSYYSKQKEHFGPYAIRSKDGTFLGLAGGDAGAVLGEYEIWYFVRRDMWGKKIATQAVALLLEQMKNSERVQLIKAEAVVNNERSWRFLEKLGFQRKQILPDGHEKNGMKWDRYLYAMDVKQLSCR